MSDKKIPNPEEIQKEFEDFINQKFGNQVQIIAQGFPDSMLNHRKENKPREEKKSETEQKEANPLELKFNLKPRDIKSHLDRFVIGQDEAKKALSIAVCDHYNQIIEHNKNPDDSHHEHYSKQNVLILGPTGVGKTYMVKQIAKLIGVPFVKADATRFSETGYMGANVDDLVKDLVNQAGGDIKKAEYGIIYLDEADKLASAGNSVGKDVNGRGVQLGLLKLMEETDVDLRAGNDPASQMQAFLDMQQKGRVEKKVVNTKHILFIVSGAFTGLSELIEKRIDVGKIGFSNKTETESHSKNSSNRLHDATTEDFINYGFEPEFVGRLPVRVACDPLDADKLFEILKKSEGSIINQYKQSFKSYGISLNFADSALTTIAKKAAKEQTGARSLMTICESIFRDYKFELPSTDIDRLTIDQAIIENPAEYLKNLLKTANRNYSKELSEIKMFEKDFTEHHNMKIIFQKEAALEIIHMVEAKGKAVSIYDFCKELLQSYEHGLKLIKQNTGQNEFYLNVDVVHNPKTALESLIKESYNN